MPDERRRYFRIDEVVKLRASRINKDQLDERLSLFWSRQHQFSTLSEEDKEKEQHLADFNTIEKKTPELARYLSVMQKQIDALAAILTPSTDDFTNSQQTVNLSAQGILYCTDEELSAGDFVDLHMELIETAHKIIILGRVIQVKAASEGSQGRFQVSLNFEHIHDADQELLIKHVHNMQLRAVAQARANDI